MNKILSHQIVIVVKYEILAKSAAGSYSPLWQGGRRFGEKKAILVEENDNFLVWFKTLIGGMSNR